MAMLNESAVMAWVESALGTRVVSSARQARETGGRPAWFVTCRNGGGEQRYYIRGNRGPSFAYNSIYSLDREARLLKLLHREGIPVPRVIADSADPYAVILEFVDGQDDFTLIQDPRERDQIARQFGEIMAKWHSIPADKFEAIGFRIPRTPQDYVIADLEVWEAGHFPHLQEPVPLVTFACRWMRRNIPKPPERPVLCQGDTGPGQFIYKDGRIQAIVDWELAFIGDPMNDLARLRAREVWNHTGKLPKWFEYYSQYSGVPIDRYKVSYYSVIAMMTTALALGPVVQQLDPRDAHAEWISEDICSKRGTVEALAEAMNIKLEPTALPSPEPTYISRLFDVIEENLRHEQLPAIGDKFLRYRLDTTARLVTHARHVAEIGGKIEAMELDDMGSILGRAPKTRRDGMLAMEEFVRSAGPEMDEKLTRYFHRHALREEALMRGVLGRSELGKLPAFA